MFSQKPFSNLLSTTPQPNTTGPLAKIIALKNLNYSKNTINSALTNIIKFQVSVKIKIELQVIKKLFRFWIW